MPQHKSCQKRMRTSRKQNAYNRAVKSSVKTATKKFLAASSGSDAGADAEAAYRSAATELDRAARKGVIPRRRADRKKSRLAKTLNRASKARFAGRAASPGHTSAAALVMCHLSPQAGIEDQIVLTGSEL